jgi:hypothetical protein
MRKSGFTLVEAVMASAVMLVVLGALAIAVGAYFGGQKRISARRDALALAAAEVADFERSGAVDGPGLRMRTESFMGAEYAVRTEISDEAPGVLCLDVEVSSPAAGEVDLQRKFYLSDGGAQ